MSGPKVPTDLEMAVLALFGIYETNKGGDGKLNKDALLKVLKDELPSFDQSRSGFESDIFKGVDLNDDGSVDFHEFAMMVAKFASVHHDIFMAYVKAAKETRK